jgi:hypothetical protein
MRRDDEDVLAEALSRAEQDLVLSTGNAPLCQISGDLQATKYFEGRWAALRALRGRIDECGRDLEQAQRDMATRSGVAWVSYSRGAIDALTEMCASLRAAAP